MRLARKGMLVRARRLSRLTRRRGRGVRRRRRQARAHRGHGPDAPRVRQAVQHDQRPVAAEQRRQLPERHRRRHGLGDGRQSQRHGQRHVPEAHGLVGRGLPRHRQRARQAARTPSTSPATSSYDQFKLHSIARRLHEAGRRTCTRRTRARIVACVGEKSYQVRSMTAGSADSRRVLGSTHADRRPLLTGCSAAPYRPSACSTTPGNAGDIAQRTSRATHGSTSTRNPPTTTAR